MKVLLVDEVHENLAKKFEGLGWVCQEAYDWSREEVLERIHEYEGMIIRSKFKVTEDLIQRASNLKFIGRSGAGMENIDLLAAREHNIQCFNSPEGNRDAVGEHALGMLLQMFNHLSKADAEVREGIWNRPANRGNELGEKTVGILGYGFMGSSFAQKISGLSCEILAYDKFKSGFGNELIQEVNLEEFKERTEVLSIHTNLTPETRGMVNYHFLKSFKNPLYLVNTARGPIVPLDDLAGALKEGIVLGACLDVLETEGQSFEKMQSSPGLEELLKSDAVFFSPHVAGWTHESNYKMASVLAGKIIKAFS
ncbi:hydroxyacid dehydrogenase [Salibacteraceae bacterium]|jgi:D-3-phosphoglycerate dehydrogenase|nr:hydroxyacid dehydrogenase [Salibacteraceae bacterium]